MTCSGRSRLWGKWKSRDWLLMKTSKPASKVSRVRRQRTCRQQVEHMLGLQTCDLLLEILEMLNIWQLLWFGVIRMKMNWTELVDQGLLPLLLFVIFDDIFPAHISAPLVELICRPTEAFRQIVACKGVALALCPSLYDSGSTSWLLLCHLTEIILISCT